MHYSAVLVVALPAQMQACLAALEALPGVEAHYSDEDSRRVVAVQETETLPEQEEGLRQIQSLPSVELAEWVYHYTDPEDAPEKEPTPP